MDDITEIWQKYQKGVEQHTEANMYTETEAFHNFYIGDQWHGAKVGDEELPVFNIIKPICKYKVAMIAQNQMSIVYLPMRQELAELAAAFTKFAQLQWEKAKMDTLSWSVIRNTCIAGDHYLYCFDGRRPSSSAVLSGKPELRMRSVHKTDIYLADEQNPSLNEQEWIIVAERLPVVKLRRIAEQNGITAEQVAQITSDEDTATRLGEQNAKEVHSELGKATSLLYMELVTDEQGNRTLKYARATRSVVYEPPRTLPLACYPLVGMRWEERVGDSRGVSAVKQLMSNQLIINKTAARRAIAAKRFAFPAVVYDSSRLQNASLLATFGATIPVEGLSEGGIGNYVQYLNPAPISPDAQNLQGEMMVQTQKLEGAGDAAMGQVDPTKASGEAIRAARDQAAVPLNEQVAAYKQLVEDIALLWFHMWVAYSPNGLQIEYMQEGQPAQANISPELLQGLDLDIKVEVSPVDPFSRISQEIALGSLLGQQHITFEEYVDALEDTASVPKSKLAAMLEARRTQPQLMEGGEPNAMPTLQA